MDPGADQDRERREFEHGKDVLRDRGGTYAGVVDAGEQHDRGDSERHREPVRQVKQRKRIVGECHRHRGDGARRDDEHQRPAVQKCRQRAEGLAQIDVAAAGTGTPLAQLAPAKRADQRNYATDHPRQQHQPRRAQPLGDGGGRAKDPAADDPADDCHRAREQPETPQIRWHATQSVTFCDTSGSSNSASRFDLPQFEGRPCHPTPSL